MSLYISSLVLLHVFFANTGESPSYSYTPRTWLGIFTPKTLFWTILEFSSLLIVVPVAEGGMIILGFRLHLSFILLYQISEELFGLRLLPSLPKIVKTSAASFFVTLRDHSRLNYYCVLPFMDSVHIWFLTMVLRISSAS